MCLSVSTCQSHLDVWPCHVVVLVQIASQWCRTTCRDCASVVPRDDTLLPHYQLFVMEKHTGVFLLFTLVFLKDVVVHLEPSSASHWVSQWELSSTALTTQVLQLTYCIVLALKSTLSFTYLDALEEKIEYKC